MASTIECPHCKGRVSPHRRGMALADALANHIQLSHTINGVKPKLKAPTILDAPPTLSKRRGLRRPVGETDRNRPTRGKRNVPPTPQPRPLSKTPPKKLSKTPRKRSA